MATKTLKKWAAVRKKITREVQGRSEALYLAHALLTVGLQHCDVSENLDQSSELVELHDALRRGLRSSPDHTVREVTKGRRLDRWLFSCFQDFNRVGLDRLTVKWVKRERYAAALYAFMEIIWRQADEHLEYLDKEKNLGGYRDPKSSPTPVPETKTLAVLTLIGRHFLQVLVTARMLDSALAIYRRCPSLGEHGPTAAALLEQAMRERRLEDIRALRETLVLAEPNHSLLEQADEAITRLTAYEKLRAEKHLDADSIKELTGEEFEQLVADQFTALGFSARRIGRGGDFGADVKVTTEEGCRVLIQCKRHNSKVNLKAVQEVLGALGHYGGDFGIVITNNGFLNSAKKLAESNDVELWGSDRLARFLTGDVSFSELAEL